jgi:hypothetical protein
MARDRLEAFVRAMQFRAPDVDPARTLKVLSAVLDGVVEETGVVEDEVDTRTFVKVVALTIAFYEEVRVAMNGEVELDDREEAILDAVVAYLAEVAARRGGDA